MIKNIVFDLGNVIIRWNPDHIVSQYEQDEQMQKQLIAGLFGSLHWQNFDHGTILREDLITHVQQVFTKEYHDTIHDMIHHWHKYAPPITGMEQLVKDLKAQGYKIYLLSNTNIHFDEYKDTIPALQHFDGYYISAQRKLVKPDPAIYHDFLQTFDLIAEECLFIDDLKANVESAISVGIDGYHFDGNVDDLRKYIGSVKA